MGNLYQFDIGSLLLCRINENISKVIDEGNANLYLAMTFHFPVITALVP